MSAEVSVHLGNVNYACTVSDGHRQWMIDEPMENGGNDTAHSPYAALLASIGSCTAITIKMYAQRKGWIVEAIEVKMSLAIQTVAGKRKTSFTRNVFVKGNLNSEQLMRLQQIAMACPISKILEGEIVIETDLVQMPDTYRENMDSLETNL